MPAARAPETAWCVDPNEDLPSRIDGVNLVLNRARLATFLDEFAEDRDVRDLLALDLLGSAADLAITSTGVVERIPGLALRPFRLWEYTWLYKALGLSAGGLNVLDLGGPASHLSILAAMAGCRVTSVDLNPEFVEAAWECARVLKLGSLEPRQGDMRDLSAFADDSFDVVLSCSVLEHLTARDQEIALMEMGRVLKPGGLIGLTFDYGPGAPGANEHLPPPHEPPPDAREVLRRFVSGDLTIAGNPFVEDPIPGSLFRHETIKYTVASLFLGNRPEAGIRGPQCQRGGSVLGKLVVAGLPQKLYVYANRLSEAGDAGNALAHAERAARYLDDLQLKDKELGRIRLEADRRERALEEATAAAHQLRQRVAVFENTAAERLEALLEKEEAISRLSAEVNNVRAQLEQATAAREDLEQRATNLEASAAERLAAMAEKDQMIARVAAEADDLRIQLEQAAAARAELQQRAASLEAAAAERLEAMLQKEDLISRLNEQLRSLHVQWEQAVAAIDESRQRAALLEAAAADRLEALKEKEEEISRLDAAVRIRDAQIAEIREQLEGAAAFERRFLESEELRRQLEGEREKLQRQNLALGQRVRKLEEENWREYLSRRWRNRQRSNAG